MLKFSIWMKKSKIHILQTFFFDATVFSVIAAKLSRRIKVISCKRDMGFWYTPMLLWILKRLRHFIDIYVTNSIAIKELIIEKEKVRSSKIQVIYNGIDPPQDITLDQKKRIKERYKIHETDIVIGSVANLNRRVKRVDLLIKAGSILVSKRKSIKFVIVGGGHLLPEFTQLAAELGVDDHFIFTGLLPDPQPLISIFDIGVMASDSEGFSNAVIEYMINGIPVVVSDSGGNREIVDNGLNGFLFEPGNADALARALNMATCSMNNQDELRTRNQIKAMNYHWSRIILKHQRLYHHLYQGRRSISYECRP